MVEELNKNKRIHLFVTQDKKFKGKDKNKLLKIHFICLNI